MLYFGRCNRFGYAGNGAVYCGFEYAARILVGKGMVADVEEKISPPTAFLPSGGGVINKLFGLFADVGEYAAVDVQNVSVDCVGRVGGEEYRGACKLVRL